MSTVMQRQINMSVSPVVYARLEQMAKVANMPTGTYARVLLEAAYSARVKPPTGDLDLDKAVARVALLFGTKFDTATIAETLDVPERLVAKILAAWREEMKARRAA
jgi:hypothetical protein